MSTTPPPDASFKTNASYEAPATNPLYKSSTDSKTDQVGQRLPVIAENVKQEHEAASPLRGHAVRLLSLVSAPFIAFAKWLSAKFRGEIKFPLEHLRPAPQVNLAPAMEKARGLSTQRTESAQPTRESEMPKKSALRVKTQDESSRVKGKVALNVAENEQRPKIIPVGPGKSTIIAAREARRKEAKEKNMASAYELNESEIEDRGALVKLRFAEKAKVGEGESREVQFGPKAEFKGKKKASAPIAMSRPVPGMVTETTTRKEMNRFLHDGYATGNEVNRNDRARITHEPVENTKQAWAVLREYGSGAFLIRNIEDESLRLDNWCVLSAKKGDGEMEEVLVKINEDGSLSSVKGDEDVKSHASFDAFLQDLGLDKRNGVDQLYSSHPNL